jgi:hypothetical protein
VPEAVVDLLEAVEVADDHAQAAVGAARALDLDVEGLLEPAPVQQAGQRVVADGVGEVRDQAGHPVADHRHDHAGDRQRPDRRQPADDRRVVEVAQAQLDAEHRAEHRDVDQRHRQREEVEGVDRHPEIGQRAVRRLVAPAVDRERRERRPHHDADVEAPGRDAVEADQRHGGDRRGPRGDAQDAAQLELRRVRRDQREQPEKGRIHVLLLFSRCACPLSGTAARRAFASPRPI